MTTSPGGLLIDVEPASGRPVTLTGDSFFPAGMLTGAVSDGNGGTGLTVPGAVGSILSSAGTYWMSRPLQIGDIPGGSTLYLQNTTSSQLEQTSQSVGAEPLFAQLGHTAAYQTSQEANGGKRAPSTIRTVPHGNANLP